jgi:hypothetical protein
MRKNNTIAREDLENMIETKILEILGNPDAGLELREEFKVKLCERLSRTPRVVSHEEVLKELG